MRYKLHKSKIFPIIAKIFLAIFIIFIIWIVFDKTSSKRDWVLKYFPFPVAVVDGQIIYSKDIFKRLEYKNSIGSSNENNSKNDIFLRIVFERNIEKFIRLYGIEKLPNDYTPNNEIVKSIKLSEELIKNKLNEDSLKFWFYEQKNLNKKAYELAEYLLKQIQNGKEIEILSQTYNQDKSSFHTMGDLGYINESELLFEVKNALLSKPDEKIVMMPSRYGIHIIEIKNKKQNDFNENMLYLKQIFIKGNDFYDWYKKQTDGQKIYKIISI